jgi:RNase P subunit RPR2
MEMGQQDTPAALHIRHILAYQLRHIAEKKVIRLSPRIKRLICKKCCMPLEPDSTVRLNKKLFEKRKCGGCGWSRLVFLA